METLRTLRQCLMDLELPRLRIIARLWGLELRATRLHEVVAELSAAMADAANTAHAWEMLPDDQRNALTTLLDVGGWLSAATFQRRFGQIRPMGPGRLEQETPWRDPISPVEGLWYRGLIFEGFAGNAGGAYPVFFVPAELQAALPVDVPSQGTQVRLESVTPPEHWRSAGERFLDDVTTVLSFVQNGAVHPRDGVAVVWPEKTLQTLMRQLRDPDAERLAFLLHLVDHLGWLRFGEGGRLRLAPEPVTAWLERPPNEARAALIDGWRSMTGWNELWRLSTLRPDDTGTWRNDPALARAALARHLEALTSGEWVRVDDWVGAIKETDPDFQRPDGDYETWYIRDAASGEYLSGFESWDQVEGALLRALLIGPAFWLALVELSADGAVFRPTLEPTRRAEPALPVVHPDLTVEIPAEQRFQRFQLARVGDLKVVSDPYAYRLTPASLGRARQQRISLERILAFLDGLSDAPLPESVQACLDRWSERGAEVWLERAVLLRVADEGVLKQILDAPQTARYVRRSVGPTAAVIAEEDWQRLVEALVEMGLLAELDPGLHGGEKE